MPVRRDFSSFSQAIIHYDGDLGVASQLKYQTLVSLQGRIKHAGGPGPTCERGPLLQLFLSVLHKIPHSNSLD